MQMIYRVYNALLLRRSFSTSQLLQCDKTFQKFKLKQAKMQCDDGLPVYLKCGLRDRILFRFTVAYLLFNTYLSMNAIWDLIKKK